MTVAPQSSSLISSNQTGEEPSGIFRSSLLVQALGVYLPATVLFRVINFARIILLTHWMTTQQFGLLNMILLVVNVLTPLCSFGLNEAVARYVPQHEVGRSLWSFAGRSLGLLVAVTGAATIVLLVLAPLLGDAFYGQSFADELTHRDFSTAAPKLAQVTTAAVALQILYFYVLSVMKGLRMFTVLTLMELTHSLLFLAGSFVAWSTGHLSALSLAVTYAIALALPTVFLGGALARVLSRWHGQRVESAGDRFYLKLLRFSVWTTLAGVTWQVLVYYPVWYLNRVHGNDAVAIFAAVRQVGQFILLGAVAISMIVTSTVTKTWESLGREAARAQLSLAFRVTGLGLLVLCAVLALAKDWIVAMFSAKYALGADILPLQLLFFLIGAYLAFLPIHFQLIEKTRHMFWPWAIGVGSNVVIAFWLAGPHFAAIRESATWRWVGSIAGVVCPTGFSNPQGLDAAAWCGILAIGLALAMCVSLIRAERCPLDRGTYIVILSAVLLAARTWILAAGALALLVMALRTEWIVTTAERRWMLAHAAATLGRMPIIGRYLSFTAPDKTGTGSRRW